MPVRLARWRWSWWLRVPLLYTLLFALLLRPLARDVVAALPADPNHCDAEFITWALAWVSHSLLTGARHLFDANIGHPAPGQLTGSEHFLSTQVAFAPLLWLTGNPVLATNLVAFASYPLAAVSMERLLSALGYGRAVAWLAGLAFALGPLRVPFNVHVVQYLNFYLPLVALALVRLRDRPGARQAVLFASALGAGTFSSYYLAFLLWVVAGIWAGCELLRAAPARLRFVLVAGGVALVVAGGMALFSKPYFVRGAGQAGPQVLVAQGWWPGFRIIPWGLYGYPPRYQLVAVGLGVMALLARVPGTSRATVPALLLVPVGTLLMYGFPAPLAHLVIGSALGFIQWPHRFAVVANFGDVLLVASCLQAIAWWAGRWVGWLAVAAFAAAFVMPPAFQLPRARMIEVRALTADRPVYETLAKIAGAQGGGALLELPLIRGRYQRKSCVTTEAEAMVASTIHWLPLLGSYSGYQAPHRGLLLRTIQALPAPWALEDLIDMTHLRWLLVRPPSDWKTDEQRTAMLRGLTRTRSLGPPIALDVWGWVLLPVVRTPKHPQWFAAIAGGLQPGKTVLGTPLAPLPPEKVAGAVEGVDVPKLGFVNRALWLTVRVHNNGNVDWPAAVAPRRPMILWMGLERDVPDAYRVALSSQWRSVETGERTQPYQHWLRRDVPAGETLTQPLAIPSPPAVGMYELEIRLQQIDGTAFGGPADRAARATVSFVDAPPNS